MGDYREVGGLETAELPRSSALVADPSEKRQIPGDSGKFSTGRGYQLLGNYRLITIGFRGGAIQRTESGPGGGGDSAYEGGAIQRG